MKATPNLKETGRDEAGFSEIVRLIQATRLWAVQSVNTVLISSTGRGARSSAASCKLRSGVKA
jgi:hypothetical protein